LRGFAHHAFHVRLVQVCGSGDGNLLLLAAGFILSGHAQDAVSIDIKGDFHLRNAARGWRNAVQAEATECHIIICHWAFSLQHMDVHGCLAVLGGREGFSFLDRNGGVAFDQASHDAAQGFHTQRKRGHIQQQHVLDIASQHAALDGCANGDNLIRVDALVGLLAIGVLFEEFLHHRHTG